jgi:plastocyanin
MKSWIGVHLAHARRHPAWIGGIGVVCAFAACNKSTTSPYAIVQTNTITIASSGVSPKNIQIAVGSRVLFVNNDSRSHNVTSDPHPEHTDCRAQPVRLPRRWPEPETGNLVTVRTCGFHDHDDPSAAILQGSIVIK